jgi:hypothetical protein
MKSPFLLAFIFCLLFGESDVLAQAPSDPEDVIRVETDVTNLLFTATDKQRRFITGLRKEDIRVLEDGVPQKLFTFQRETDRPLSIAFLIDVSVSEDLRKKQPHDRLSRRSFNPARTRRRLFRLRARRF